MASSVSYSDEGEDSIISDINVTPLVDIVLVLLIVFMITVPSIVNNPSIKVELPKAAWNASASTPEIVSARANTYGLLTSSLRIAR